MQPLQSAIRLFLLFGLIAILSACASVPRNIPQASASKQQSAERVAPRTAVRNFITVVERVEPVAEAFCSDQRPASNCDFLIVVDDDPRSPANAYQTEDDTGRPIIAFTLALIGETRNQDELAFILSHEAAHHIQGHLAQTQRNASLGAFILGQLTAGASTQAQQTAQQLGATIGARTYSKEFELEADALGTRITAAAGYDPLIGAEFFNRIPDPGNRFLGTHPANADRIETVRRVAAGL